MYGASSAIVASRLTPFARSVTSRMRRLNRSRAFGAIVRLISFMVRMGLSTTLRMPETEIWHTTSAQPTRMTRVHVRARERPADRPSVGFLKPDRLAAKERSWETLIVELGGSNHLQNRLQRCRRKTRNAVYV